MTDARAEWRAELRRLIEQGQPAPQPRRRLSRHSEQRPVPAVHAAPSFWGDPGLALVMKVSIAIVAIAALPHMALWLYVVVTFLRSLFIG